MTAPRFSTVLTLLLAFLAWVPPANAQQKAGIAADEADVVMVIPLTTESSEALNHYMQARRALDMGRPEDARPHLEQAIAADAEFAIAYLDLANAATSLEMFKRNLDLAKQHAEAASEAEQLVVEFALEGFENDVQAQIETARQLVDLRPESPRAWMMLASAQSSAGDVEAARRSWSEALEVSPEFIPAHMALANSYLFTEPLDLATAEQHMQEAVELEPDEAVLRDILGDVYRAQGRLQKAAQEYTRVTELDPDAGNGFQQRAHVHSFVGDFEKARADYDAAIEREEGNAKANFRVWRALVHVHSGAPRAAIVELEGLVDEVDGMNIPSPRGAKLFALSTIAQIAIHHEMTQTAEEALERRNELLMEQAEEVGTEAARRQARATITLWDGVLAARKRNYDTAVEKANEYMTIMEPSTDPEKNEPANALLGYTHLWQGNYEKAVAHFKQASEDDIYLNYHHALALQGAGEEEEARKLFEKVANWNFNNAGVAMVKKDAAAKID